jgi:phosphonate transport system substrate-binding protein
MKRSLLPLIVIALLIIPFAGSNSPASSRNQITMILLPLKPPSTMYKNFLPLKRYLEKNLDVSIRIKVAKDSSDIIRHLETGEADMAFLCPTLYCVSYNRVPIVPLVKLRINGTSEYRSLLLVREDSPVKKTADLLDGTFVYGRYQCPESGLLPRVMLKRVGISDKDLLESVKLGSDESAMISVMAKMFDATGVSEMAAKPYIGNGLRVLRHSYSIPQYVFVARASLGKDFIQRLKKTMLSINGLEDPKSIIGSIESGVDGFSEAEDRDYDIVRVLIKNIPGEKDIILKEKRGIKFVVEPVFFEPDLFRRLNPLITHLSKKTGLTFQLLIPENVEDFIDMQNKGEGAIFLQNPHLYTKMTESNRYRAVASIAETGSPEGRIGIIITNSSGRIKTPKDLAGKKIGITSHFSDDGYLSQREMLIKEGVPLDSLNFIKLKTYENVIMNVYRGSVDAGFVSLPALRSMEQDIDMDRIIIVAKTPPLPEWVMSLRKGFDALLADKVIKALPQFQDKTDFRIKPLKN